MIHGDLTLQMTGDVDDSALRKQGLWTVQVKSSQISWIRHLGAMQAKLDLCGCTGVAWDVTDIIARAFFQTAGVAGTARAWLVWVASVTGAAGAGCIHLKVGVVQVVLLRSVVKLEPAVWQLCHMGQCRLL